jgi:hypothetical protein
MRSGTAPLKRGTLLWRLRSGLKPGIVTGPLTGRNTNSSSNPIHESSAAQGFDNVSLGGEVPLVHSGFRIFLSRNWPEAKKSRDMAFAFSFAGDDIEEDLEAPVPPPQPQTGTTATGPSPSTARAFPVQGKPLLPPTQHELDDLLSRLPSKIAFSLLDVRLGDGRVLQLPRRELWDVRVQLMAEENIDNPSESEAGLGDHDVKTGIYEGGFKSWESSVDLVKVLASEKVGDLLVQGSCVLIEVRYCVLAPTSASSRSDSLLTCFCSLVAARRYPPSLCSSGRWVRGSPKRCIPWCSSSQTTTLPFSIS